MQYTALPQRERERERERERDLTHRFLDCLSKSTTVIYYMNILTMCI